MLLKIRIQRNQVHHWKDVEIEGGGTVDMLQFGICCPDYPDLPTYGIRVPFPITKVKVLAAITEKVTEIKEQMQRDGAMRSDIDGWGLTEVNGFYEIDVEVN